MTLIGSTGSGSVDRNDETPTEERPITTTFCGKVPKSPLPERKRPRQLVTAAQPVIEMKTNILPPTPTSLPDAIEAAPLVYNQNQNGITTAKIHSTIAAIAMTATAIVPQSASSSTTIIVSPSKSQPNQPTIIATVSSGSSTQQSAISPPHLGLYADRRPSMGGNIIPHAALCQHRYSLQLNGDGGVKVSAAINLL